MPQKYPTGTIFIDRWMDEAEVVHWIEPGIYFVMKDRGTPGEEYLSVMMEKELEKDKKVKGEPITMTLKQVCEKMGCDVTIVESPANTPGSLSGRIAKLEEAIAPVATE